MRASDAHVSRDPAWHDATCHICPRGKGDHLPHVPISAVPLSHPTARHLSLHAPHLPERKTKASTRITHKPLALSRRVPPVCHVGIAGEAAGDDGGGGRGRRGGGRGRVVVRATDDDGARRGAAAMASSCWGRLGLAALWHRLRQLSVARRRRRHGGGGGGRSILGAGGLNYDPLSYAQNFDDGCLEPDFTVTARFAPPRSAGSPRLPPAAPAAASA